MHNMSKRFLMKVIFILLVLISVSSVASQKPEIYRRYFYVSNRGDDNNSGLSPQKSWRTLDKVNNFKFSPGDTICFKNGDTWRGQLVPQSGNEQQRIKYTQYGGASQKPQILGSIEKSKRDDWELTFKNIWSTAADQKDIGNIIFNHSLCGVKVWKLKDLKKQNQFYYDRMSYRLYLYSEQNPASKYSSIECAVRKTIINQTNKRYIEYDGLSIKYGAAHGFGGGSVAYITIENCDVSYIGGGNIHEDERQERFGNGIEFWGEAHDNLVKGCNIWEVYDAALTNQSSGQKVKQNNIVYIDNKVWNCEYSFEYFNFPSNSSSSDIYFINNSCKNAGAGWGHNQRPDPSGRHICLLSNEAYVKYLVIKGNTFDGAEQAIILVGKKFKGINGLIFSNNKYAQNGRKIFVLWGDEKYFPEDYKRFVADKKQDKGSSLKIS